jgi:rod shape determining protein RodA
MGSRRESRISLQMDWWFLGAAVFLIVAGLMSLYSLTIARADNPHATNFFQKQLLSLLVGAVPFCLFLFTPLRVWRRYATPLYWVGLALLLLVLVKGTSVNGSVRWIDIGSFRFQPSELVKLVTIFSTTAFLMKRQDKIQEFSTLALSFLHIVPAMALIFKQPAYGTAMSLFVIWFCVCLAAGVRIRLLMGLLGGGAAVVGLLILLVPRLVLTSYQLDRIGSLISRHSATSANHTLTPAERAQQKKIKDTAMQVDNSETAIATGGVFGKGFRRGDLKRTGFVPEQEDDFVFTIVGEEGGLIGSAFVLVGFGVFFFRLWLAMIETNDPYHRMLLSGILGLLAFHMTINLFMVLGMFPVAGLWLPFMSYGGSALWLCLSCVAVVLNIRNTEYTVLLR